MVQKLQAFLQAVLESLFLAQLQPHFINSSHYNPSPIYIPEQSLYLDTTTDFAQQNQYLCWPGRTHAPKVTWHELCLRHHRSRDPTWSTPLKV